MYSCSFVMFAFCMCFASSLVYYNFTQGIANFKGEIPVAVKTLSCRAPNMLQKFIEEIDLMKAFCHPNIVSLLGKKDIILLNILEGHLK